jgi:DNA recombination protein RmuC
VQRNIGEFSEIGRSMKSLQEFLQSPKRRGTIGEEVMIDLIKQMFPQGSYFVQYTFKSGSRVDAAIKTDGGMLTIDAKFPMENYVKMYEAEIEKDREQYEREFIKDIKRHIDAISEKYILPDEGTLDFSLMYVPSESVFYDLAQIHEVMTYARKKRVYPVSPTTLYAHLQTILLSFAGKQMEVKTKTVFKMLRSMLADYEKIEGSLGVLGKHLTNAYGQMQQVNQGFSLLGHKLKSSQSLGGEVITQEPLIEE